MLSTYGAIQMRDPLEGVTPVGTIRTGVGLDRVPVEFEPVLRASKDMVRAADAGSSLYVYGSVATGMAQPGESDVDLVTIGLPSTKAAEVGIVLSRQFSDLCRAVQVAAAQPSDFSGDSDEDYGGRVFLRHYCAHLVGPDRHSALPDFPADARAARGFNGDIAENAQRWRLELAAERDAVELSRSLARKSLFAVAGLVSVHDHTWTTDRAIAAARWGEIQPALADDLQMLLAWSSGTAQPDLQSVEAALNGVIDRIVCAFEASIGLWNSETPQ